MFFKLSGLFGYQPGGTVYTRITKVAGSDGLVGYALDALREACFGAHSDRLILIDDETLTRAGSGSGCALRTVGSADNVLNVS